MTADSEPHRGALAVPAFVEAPLECVAVEKNSPTLRQWPESLLPHPQAFRARRP
jgi:hypothetical protein